ncbi:MAG: hypothetical protein WC783_00410 [Candidatus Paceibacterota bacterium]|jgi:hypothetical protein
MNKQIKIGIDWEVEDSWDSWHNIEVESPFDVYIYKAIEDWVQNHYSGDLEAGEEYHVLIEVDGIQKKYVVVSRTDIVLSAFEEK